jgi:hypothetical protein
MKTKHHRTPVVPASRQFVLGLLLLACSLTAQAAHVFQVTGSGIEDNTAELQAAFDAASVAGPGAIVQLGGMLYTGAIRIEGFHGKVRADDEHPPTIDVLRGLDPGLPGVAQRVGKDGKLVPKPLFEFVDSTVRMQGPITFHITAGEPSDLHLHGPMDIPTTELGNIIRFAGRSDAEVNGVTLRGGPGSIMDGGGSWNVRVGIAFFTSEPFPFGDPTFGSVKIHNSQFDDLFIAVSADSLVDANIELRKNRINRCGVCLIFTNTSGSEARYSENNIVDARILGVIGVQLNEPGVGPSQPISYPSRLRLYSNSIQTLPGSFAGYQVVDQSRLIHGVKTIDLHAVANDISGDGFGAALSIAVQDQRFIGNRIAGNWFLGVDAFLGANDCTILGNSFGRSKHREGISAPGGVVSIDGSENCDVLLNRFVDVSGTAVQVYPESRVNRIRFNNYRKSGILECAIRLQGDNNVVTEYAFPKGTDASTQVCDEGEGNVVNQ